MIELQSLYKSFAGPEGAIRAVEDVSLTVREGDIYGIVGFSGAGKTTLLRLVNGREKADSGTVTVAGQVLNALSPKELLAARRKIGMVFQQFNLLEGKTVKKHLKGWSP